MRHLLHLKNNVSHWYKSFTIPWNNTKTGGKKPTEVLIGFGFTHEYILIAMISLTKEL
jgi:hypothetical protein